MIWTAVFVAGPLDGTQWAVEGSPRPPGVLRAPMHEPRPSMVEETDPLDVTWRAVEYPCTAMDPERRIAYYTFPGRPMGLAESVLHALDPVTDEVAGDAVRRIRAAEDPDAEAEAVIADWTSVLRDAMDGLRANLSAVAAGVDDEFLAAGELCWRCDAHTAETDVGLCEPCRDDLRQ